MFRPVAFNIGLRYALSRRSFVSFISVVAISGLVLSVAVLLLVTAVMNGFEREMRERILALVPHVQLRGRIADSEVEQIRDRTLQIDQVLGAAPYVEASGLIAAKGASAGVTFTGIDPQRFESVSDLGRFVTEGSLTSLVPGRFAVVLGRPLALRLNVAVGDTVMAVLPDGAVTIVGLIPRQKRLEVVGIFDTHSELDSRAVYIALADGQRMFRMKGTVQGLNVRVNDVFAAGDIAARAVAHIGEGAGLSRVVDASARQFVSGNRLSARDDVSSVVAVGSGRGVQSGFCAHHGSQSAAWRCCGVENIGWRCALDRDGVRHP
ncbi:MAG: hypothetical protein HC809_10295, partial [Gammaproteobacteria bacterium]|nr:hypothetical protein [Gammaproteobacteria bacterium]